MNDKEAAPGRYKTTNWKEYNAALKSRGSLTMWLDTGMQWLAQPNGKRGRDQTFSDAAIQFCLTIKCLYGLPLRQSLGMVQSLLQLAGLDWPVPDFSTVSVLSACPEQLSCGVSTPNFSTIRQLRLMFDGGAAFLVPHGAYFLCNFRGLTQVCTCPRRTQW